MSKLVHYQFLHSAKPGAYRKRNGQRGVDVRSQADWAKALEGHVRVSHGGVFQESCAGCRELEKKSRSK